MASDPFPVRLASTRVAIATLLLAIVSTQASAGDEFDDRVVFDAALAARNGNVQFEDWDGLSSSVGTTGLANNPIPPWPAFITGTAIDTGYSIGSESITLAFIQTAGDIGNVQVSRAFGSNQALPGIGLIIALDDANVLGVDVASSQTANATLFITVFDTTDTLIDSYSRPVVPSTPVFFGYIGETQVGSVRFEVIQGGVSGSPVEYVDNMTFGNATPATVPGLSAWGLLALFGVLVGATRAAARSES